MSNFWEQKVKDLSPMGPPLENDSKTTGDYADFLVSLGEALSRIRRDVGLTQGQLASRAGRKQPAIAKIENGPVPNIALRVIYEICQAVPMPLSALFQRAEARLVQTKPARQFFNEHWRIAME